MKSAQMMDGGHINDMDAASSDETIFKLTQGFREANFEPITLLGIARKLSSIRIALKDTLQGSGNWVDEYFGHVIDVLTHNDYGAKPNISKENKRTIKQIVCGNKSGFH